MSMHAREPIAAVHMPVCEMCGQSVSLARRLEAVPAGDRPDARAGAGTPGGKTDDAARAGIPPLHFPPKPPGGGGRSFRLKVPGFGNSGKHLGVV
jgi:hypothetical protein